ncbi:KTSC domain-containing protein [Sphingomonas beigongshangi]|uniref:KTSC domain-containing protein n=1 Tax=Sphingomonas beigongshangi TaxID=2782540 RepID=UPI003B845485
MPHVSSSAMHRVEYDAIAGRLDIWFNDSGRYSYFGVPVDVYNQLLAAGSKGAFFNNHIRDRYRDL